MSRLNLRGSSATPTIVRESLFDRLRRRLSQPKNSSPAKVPQIDDGDRISRSKSVCTLVRAEDLEDQHSVNTSSLDSDSQPVLSHRFIARDQHIRSFSTRQLSDDHIVRHTHRQRQAEVPNSSEQERKRLVNLLSTQGISLLHSLDNALSKKEHENARLKTENRNLVEQLQHLSQSVSQGNLLRTPTHREVGFPGIAPGGSMSELIQVQQQLNRSASLLEEKIAQTTSDGEEIARLLSQNGDLNRKMGTLLMERKTAESEIASLKRQLRELQKSTASNDEFYALQNKYADIQREKENSERQLQQDLQQARHECSRLTSELSKNTALVNEVRSENRQLTSKYEALVLQHAELTRSCKTQSAAYQELQKRVTEMADDQFTNDSILQATIQMAKKADRERKRIYGVAENTGKLYETYFAEYESDAQTLRAKLKILRSHMLRNKKVYENLLSHERAKNMDRLRAKDDELSYLRALLGNRDADVSKVYGRYTAATELLGMSLLMQPSPKLNLSDGMP